MNDGMSLEFGLASLQCCYLYITRTTSPSAADVHKDSSP